MFLVKLVPCLKSLVFVVKYPVSDSMELIEKDYVLVNAHFASLEAISCYREPSLQLERKIGAPFDTPEQNEQGRPLMQAKELGLSSVGGAESSPKHEADMLPTSSASTILREVQGLSILHPSTRIQLLHQYVQVLAELSLEKVCYRILTKCILSFRISSR